ncbi:MAG: SRPBCC family protein [Actinocatenispora sp.]
MRGSVTVHMKAPADRVWSLISDVTQIGRFSPETFEAEWLDGVTAPTRGARFRGHVRRNEKGPVYWTECTVVACEPGREFAFAVGPGASGSRGTGLLTWSYVLTDVDDGTDVTESFELADTLPMRLYWALLGRFRGRRNERDMRRTLHAMKAVVES